MINSLMLKAFVAAAAALISNMTAQGADSEEKRLAYRDLLTDTFRLSDTVPAKHVPAFCKIVLKSYDSTGSGFHGVAEEVFTRTAVIAVKKGSVPVREFFVHNMRQSDFVENRRAYELKTGCGDWLRSEDARTLDEVLKEYRRKRTILRWVYVFNPASEDMNGQKSFNARKVAQGKTTAPERIKTKKDGTKVINKQYPININIECSYKQFFDYLATYPAGIGTFFKESKRPGKLHVWELQTIKNSKKKIDFLQACPFNRAKPETEEEEE